MKEPQDIFRITRKDLEMCKIALNVAAGTSNNRLLKPKYLELAEIIENQLRTK